jgi:hypothetical protein
VYWCFNKLPEHTWRILQRILLLHAFLYYLCAGVLMNRQHLLENIVPHSPVVTWNVMKNINEDSQYHSRATAPPFYKPLVLRLTQTYFQSWRISYTRYKYFVSRSPMRAEILTVSYVNWSLGMSIYKRHESAWQISVKFSNIKFHFKLFNGSLAVTGVKRWTDRKFLLEFHSKANASKAEYTEINWCTTRYVFSCIKRSATLT